MADTLKKYFGPSAGITTDGTGKTILSVTLDELKSSLPIKNFPDLDLSTLNVAHDYFGILIILQLGQFWSEKQGDKVPGKALTVDGPSATPIVEDMGNGIKMMFDALALTLTFRQEIDFPFALEGNVMLKNGKGE